MSNETLTVLAVVAVALVVLGCLIAFVSALYNEAERKLGREVTTGETLFALAVILFLPSGGLLLLAAYVWLVMPDLSAEKSRDT